MNYSAEDYLNQLDVDKENLVNALNSLQITASTSETFTELVPKVDLYRQRFVKDTMTGNIYNCEGWVAKNAMFNATSGYPDIYVADDVTSLAKILRDWNHGKPPKVFCNNQVTDAQYAYYCALPLSLAASFINEEIVDLSGLNTENITDWSNCFACINQTILTSNYDQRPILNLEPLSFEHAQNFNSTFERNSLQIKLETAHPTPNLTSMSRTFQYIGSGTTEHTFDFLQYLDLTHVTNFYYTFYNCNPSYSNRTYNPFILTYLRTDSATGMTGTFSYITCGGRLSIPNLDTSNVVDAGSMFAESWLQPTNITIDLPATLDFSNCTSCYRMFYGQFSQPSGFTYDLVSFGYVIGPRMRNVQNVTTMQEMFCYQTPTRAIADQEWDLSNLITGAVTNAQGMFRNNAKIKKLNLSGFTINNTCNCSQMFQGCSKLTLLDIRSLEFSKVTNHTDMFTNVPNDCVIVVKDATEKSTLEGWFSNLTGVITASDYDALQGGV